MRGAKGRWAIGGPALGRAVSGRGAVARGALARRASGRGAPGRRAARSPLLAAFVAALGVAALAAGGARADCWAVLPTRADAERAVALLRPGDLAVAWCSSCTDEVEVVEIVSATILPWLPDGAPPPADGEELWTVEVRARRLYRSLERFPPAGYAPARATFVRVDGERADGADVTTTLAPDLAYFYVERRGEGDGGRGRFVALALAIGLPTPDIVAELVLPFELDSALERFRAPRPEDASPRPGR